MFPDSDGENVKVPIVISIVLVPTLSHCLVSYLHNHYSTSKKLNNLPIVMGTFLKHFAPSMMLTPILRYGDCFKKIVTIEYTVQHPTSCLYDKEKHLLIFKKNFCIKKKLYYNIQYLPYKVRYNSLKKL